MKLNKLLASLLVTTFILASCADDTESDNETATETSDTSGETETEVEDLQQELDNAYARIDELESQLNEGDSSEQVEEAEPDESSQDSDEIYEFNEMVADNENYTAALLSIESLYDDDWEESTIEVVFDIENKSSETINVQAREVAINGRMTNESSFYMSGGEISPGNSAYVTLIFEDYGSGDLPELEGNFEMQLRIFDWDYNVDSEEYVTVSFD